MFSVSYIRKVVCWRPLYSVLKDRICPVWEEKVLPGRTTMVGVSKKRVPDMVCPFSSC